MVQTYPEALAYLYDNLPMFQRIGAAALKNDLSNTLRLCDILGNPQRRFRTIHVAGTNGKGSTSHMLASVLQTAGYRTGLYTSPHLKSFTERIRIDGSEISPEFVVDFVNRVQPVIREIEPSFFEITVAMAFEYFAQQHVDVAVIEVGLGGRLDATNVITPVLSVITNIGWDHKDILGDTLAAIASEKAGIIKPQVPVVISSRQAEVEQVFTDKAQREQAPLHFANDFAVDATVSPNGYVFRVMHEGKSWLDNIHLPLQGLYQQKNLAGVIKAVSLLRTMDFDISDAQLKAGLEDTVRLTGLKGRWQKLGDRPMVVCDTGHNIDGIREVLSQIRQQTFAQLFMIIGMVKDKDISEILSLFPKDARYYFCQASIPRALDAELLATKARATGLTGEVVRDVNDALAAAKVVAQENDFIFIGGSTFVVGELNNL